MSAEVNLFLLRQLPEECLAERYSARTRTVAEQFAHMHAVRIRWLEHAAPDLARGLEKLEKSELTSDRLITALQASENAVADFLARCENKGAVPQWKGPPASFLSYLVAHEAHHRGLAMVAMRLSGRKLDKELVYGQWDWGKGYSSR